MTVKLEHYTEASLELLRQLMADYRSLCPDAKLISPEYYTYHPATQVPGNAWCVLDETGAMAGFAPIFPALSDDSEDEPQTIWTIVVARPDDPCGDEVRPLLLDALYQRAATLRREYGKESIRLASDVMVSQTADIDFLQANGFEPFSRMYVMHRAASDPIPHSALPEGVVLAITKLGNEVEQLAYLAIHNACFPGSPKSLADLQFTLSSEGWENGCVMKAALVDGTFVGSILLYPTSAQHAYVDDVMVLPGWRGRGIAKALIAEGLRYLASLGIMDVTLEVLVDNVPAVALYTGMGFNRINEEVMLGKVVS